MAPRFDEIRFNDTDLQSPTFQRLLHEIEGAPVKERNVCLALAAVSLWHMEENHESLRYSPTISKFSSFIYRDVKTQ